jgi:hypothetical protein
MILALVIAKCYRACPGALDFGGRFRLHAQWHGLRPAYAARGHRRLHWCVISSDSCVLRVCHGAMILTAAAHSGPGTPSTLVAGG